MVERVNTCTAHREQRTQDFRDMLGGSLEEKIVTVGPAVANVRGSVGRRMLARFAGNKHAWYSGELRSVNDDGSVNFRCDSGHILKVIPGEWLREEPEVPMSLTLGVADDVAERCKR